VSKRSRSRVAHNGRSPSLTDPADASRLRTIWYLSSGGSRDLADDVAHVIHDNYARVVADVLMKKVAAKTKAQARLADEIRSPSLGDVTERQNQLFVEQKGDGRFYVRRWASFAPKGFMIIRRSQLKRLAGWLRAPVFRLSASKAAMAWSIRAKNEGFARRTRANMRAS
jgi:hypothetical protein